MYNRLFFTIGVQYVKIIAYNYLYNSTINDRYKNEKNSAVLENTCENYVGIYVLTYLDIIRNTYLQLKVILHSEKYFAGYCILRNLFCFLLFCYTYRENRFGYSNDI